VLGKNTQSLFREIRVSDFVFLLVLVANLLLVIYLAEGNYQKGAKVAQIQDNAEEILVWFGDFTAKVEANEPIQPKACVPFNEDTKPTGGDIKVNNWRGCVEALFAAKGPFEKFSNLLMPEGPTYTSKCTKQDLATSGALIFEKLTLNPAGPPGVSTLEPGEKLVSGLNIRLSMCDTGYYLIKIGEFKI
jgi:hypothetical protein